jgi:predicted Zn-dependent peptidase
MQLHRTTLDNGLEVLAECNPEMHSAAVAFYVKTGARDESADVAGVSHFLEHMTFKGTPTRTSEQVNQELDALGAFSNAMTSKETTIYYTALLPEYVEKAMELLADILRPALRTKDFETEKQVIIEEIRMYEDEPPFGAFDKCEALHFGSHPLGNSVLGTVESITDLSVDAMRDYFRRRYSPGNIVLVGTGRIDFDRFVKGAERYCGQWEPLETCRAVAGVSRQPGFRSWHKPSAVQQHVVQMAAGPVAERRERYAADALACALGDSTGSRLYWALIETGEADHAGLGFSDYQGAGFFCTVISGLPEKIESNLQTVLDIYRRAERQGISQAELDQVKSKAKARTVLASERPMGRLGAVGGNWVQWREYLTVQEELAAIDAITLDEVNAIARQYPLSASTTVTIGPRETVTAPV